MNEEVADYFKLGIELGLTAIVISSLLVVGSITQSLNASMADQRATVSAIQEYRDYVKYDEQVMYYYDVINTVKEYWNDDIAVYIVTPTYDAGGAVTSLKEVYYYNGKLRTVNGANVSDWQTATNTTSAITANCNQTFYKSKLIYGANGNVRGIAFHLCKQDGSNTYNWPKENYLNQLDK